MTGHSRVAVWLYAKGPERRERDTYGWWKTSRVDEERWICRCTETENQSGNWSLGTRFASTRFHLSDLSLLDPRKHGIAAMCADVWTAAMHAFDAQLIQKYHPDEAELSAFKDAISEEFHNPDYQLYCNGFGPFGGLKTYFKVSCHWKETASYAYECLTKIACCEETEFISFHIVIHSILP